MNLCGVPIHTPPRFSEGHQLTQTEACVLSGAFSQGVGRKIKTKVAELLQGFTFEELPAESQERIRLAAQALYESTAKEFNFSPVSGNGKYQLDPIEKLAREMCREEINLRMTKQGMTLTKQSRGDLVNRNVHLFRDRARKMVELEREARLGMSLELPAPSSHAPRNEETELRMRA